MSVLTCRLLSKKNKATVDNRRFLLYNKQNKSRVARLKKIGAFRLRSRSFIFHGRCFMKQGQVWALTFCIVLFIVLGIVFPFIILADRTWESKIKLVFIGFGALLFGIAVCIPTLLPKFKEMKRRHDIKTGKIVPGAKRYHRVRRRLVDLDDVKDDYFGEDDGKDIPPRPGSDSASAW